MLWYKAWLETRWRFLIGLAVLVLSALGTVLVYPQFVRLLPLAHQVDVGGELGRRIAENAALASTLPRLRLVPVVSAEHAARLDDFRGAPRQRRTARPGERPRRPLHAVAAGLAQPPARRPGGDGARRAARPGDGAAAADPADGAVGRPDATASRMRSSHGAALFTAGSVIFSLAFYCSTIFTEVWMPLVLALCAAFFMAFVGSVVPSLAPWDSVPGHERAQLFPRPGPAMGRTARQRGRVGRTAVRRQHQHRAQGFLNKGGPQCSNARARSSSP